MSNHDHNCPLSSMIICLNTKLTFTIVNKMFMVETLIIVYVICTCFISIYHLLKLPLSYVKNLIINLYFEEKKSFSFLKHYHNKSVNGD